MAEDEQKEATAPSAQRDAELNVDQLDEASGGMRLRSSRLSSSDHPTHPTDFQGKILSSELKDIDDRLGDGGVTTEALTET